MSSQKVSNLRLKAALVAAKSGWPVFPMHGVAAEGTCTCRNASCPKPGKHPWTTHGFKDASTDRRTVEAWWTEKPDANIAIATGAISGIIVLDIDAKAGGYDSLRQIEDKYGSLPDAPTVLSGGGGRHVYLAHPDSSVTIPNIAALDGLPGLELKGDGGSVILPPSRHSSGTNYRWLDLIHSPVAIDPPAPPPWLLEIVSRSRRKIHDPAATQATAWPALLAGVPQGQRRNTALRLAGHYLAIGRARVEVEALLLGFASRCTPPFEQAEVLDVVSDLAKKHSDSVLPPKGGSVIESNFSPMSLSDLIAQTDEEIEWVWDLYLPKGRLTLLVAFMKVGKSTFAYALAIAIAQGRPFLGHSTRQGPVLILALEEHVQDVKTRLVLFGANERKDPIQVHVAALAPSPENFAAVREHVMEHGTELIIVDTLASLWNIPDENNNAEVHRRVRPWLDLAHESGCTVLLIHHERKSGGEGGRGIRGGSALFALMDQALILERRDGGAPTHRSLTAFGRYRDTPKELILELDGTTYRRIGTPTELTLESAKDKVFDALSDNPQRIQVVIESSKLKKKLVQDALDALLEEDKIIREGVGVKGKPFTYRVAE